MINAPKDHTADYDGAIHVVELHRRNTMELNEDEFASFVIDDWRWKRAWLQASKRLRGGINALSVGTGWMDNAE